MTVSLVRAENMSGYGADNSNLNQFNKIFVYSGSYLFLIALNFIDIITGTGLSLSSLYAIPVIIFSWKFRQKPALIFTFAVAFIEYMLHIIEQPINNNNSGFWNFAINLSIYLFICLLVNRFKKKFLKERMTSRRDFLTGIANRSYFMEFAVRELARCRRYHRPISVVYIDCDNFKYVNDNFGHHIGDRLLSIVAKVLKGNTRLTDLAARFGGDEFVLLLPETGVEQSKAVVKKIQNYLLKAMAAERLPVTFSIGIATFVQAPLSVEDMLSKADSLMYEVKKSSKNAINQRVFNAKDTSMHNNFAKSCLG